MGTRLFKVSDISGQIVDDEAQLTQLIVEEHPDFDEVIGLEVLPQEIEAQLPQAQEYVAFSYGTQSQRYLLPREEFNQLFPNGNADAILQRVHAEQEELRQQTAQRGRRRQQPKEPRQRIDYASPEHAGEPHRGTISEAEKTYVRDHLDEVNQRLREHKIREIDPNDPEMAERYGLQPPPSPS